MLTDIDKETRKLQALGGKMLAPERRTNFQKWLNAKASKDEKTLVKATFTSLQFFLQAHEDHSMPRVRVAPGRPAPLPQTYVRTARSAPC